MTINPTTQPANASGIMADMFSKLVKPDIGKPIDSSINKPPPVVPVAATPPVESKPIEVKPPESAKPVEQPVDKSDPPKSDTDFFVTEEEAPPIEALEVDEEPDMSDVPDSPAAENFKRMREALKNDRKTLKAKEKELAKTAKELEAWSKGEKIPDILTAKDTKIQELEKIAESVNAHLSTEYQELVVQPTIQTKAAFTKLATDYGIPENIREHLVRQIVETENERDRNTLITKHFPDSIGASKAKDLVLAMHELGQTAIDLEAKPVETRQKLQSKYQEKMQTEHAERATVFEAVSKKAWNSALERTSSEKIYSNLILDPTNPEHNANVEKNQHRAAIQFGAFIKELHKAGTKNLPENVVVGIARMVQLSIGGVDAYKQLAKATAELAEIKQSSSVRNSYFRPSPNGNGHSAPPARAADPGPRNPQEAAQRAGQSLLRK